MGEGSELRNSQSAETQSSSTSKLNGRKDEASDCMLFSTFVARERIEEEVRKSARAVWSVRENTSNVVLVNFLIAIPAVFAGRFVVLREFFWTCFLRLLADRWRLCRLLVFPCLALLRCGHHNASPEVGTTTEATPDIGSGNAAEVFLNSSYKICLTTATSPCGMDIASCAPIIENCCACRTSSWIDDPCESSYVSTYGGRTLFAT